MGNFMMDGLRMEIQWTQNTIISIGEALTKNQLSQKPGPTSPPIGWHLWHASRWADRLQASFYIDSLEGTYKGPLKTEYWEIEHIVQQWDLSKSSLGLLETGATMTVEAAVTVACIGKSKLITYAKRMFEAAEEVMSKIDDGMLNQSRYSILPELQNMPNEQPIFVRDNQTTICDEFLFHLSHWGRHLGMMEALQGSLFGVSGSASI